ncbi:MAG TPA: hypothetical protein VK963_01960 [Candidatus Saccharimonadales bacterium]|nr:hypothetical protein [Candidatus Saccharimonadales bacterium]
MVPLENSYDFDNFVRLAGLSIVLQLLAYGLIFWLGKRPALRTVGSLLLVFGTFFSFVSLLIANQAADAIGFAKTVPSWLSLPFSVLFFILPLMILAQEIVEQFRSDRRQSQSAP